VKGPNSLKTRCGSPAYTAPEIINYKPYDERVDNWSLGVIVYTLLGGYPPFYEETVHLTFQQILQANYQFHPEYWDGISNDAKNFIKSLLTIDPNARITSQQAQQHVWLQGPQRRRERQGSMDTHDSFDSAGVPRPSITRRRERKCLKANLQQFKKFNEERKRESKEVRSVSHYWILTRR